MSEPTTFKDVPEDVKAKARTLAVTVLNMGDVEIATGFMAGVLLHTSNTLIEEQSARIAELERDRDASVNCERDLMQSILQSHTLNDLHAVRETVKAIMEADVNGSK